MKATRTAVAAALAAVAAVPAVPAASRPVAPVAARQPVRPPIGGEALLPVHDHASHAHAVPAPAPVRAKAAALPARPAGRVPWDGTAFATPESAMGFLVRAYNAHDDRALAHVTTPEARRDLVAMRAYAPQMRLKGCQELDDGAYECTFWHSLAQPAQGREGYATLRVAPAARPGWYMTVLADCGDA